MQLPPTWCTHDLGAFEVHVPGLGDPSQWPVELRDDLGHLWSLGRSDTTDDIQKDQM